MLKGRLLAASSTQPPPVVVFTDTYTLTAPYIPVLGSFSTATSVYPVGGLSANNRFWALTTDGTNVKAIAADPSTVGYTNSVLSNTLTVGTNAFNQTVSGAGIDTNNFIALWPTSGSNVRAAKINQAGTTLSLTNAGTTVASAGTSYFGPEAALVDSTYALFVSPDNSSVFTTVTYWNHSTWSSVQVVNDTTKIARSRFNPIRVKALSSTLAAIAYADASLNAAITTVDITAGSSIALNNKVASTASVASTNCIDIYPINSTTLLLVYVLNSTTIGARTVTLGAGGSVTYNTEYTLTVASVDTSFQFGLTGYGSNYSMGYYNDLDGFIYMVGMQVTGSVVVFSTPVSTETGNHVTLVGGINCINMAPIDSSRFALGYSTSNATVTNRATIGTVEVNTSAPSWTFSGFNSGQWEVGTTTGGSLFSFNAGISNIMMGTNRMLECGYFSTGSLKFYVADLCAGTTVNAIYNNTTADSGVASSPVGAMALLPSYQTGGNPVSRALVSAYSGTAVEFSIVSVTVDGTPSIGSSSSKSPSGIASGGANRLFNMDNTNCLYLYAATSGRIGGIVVVPGATTSVTTVGTPVIIYTASGASISSGSGSFQAQRINNTQAMVLVQGLNGGSTNQMDLFIATVGSGTVTAGAVATIFTGYSNTSKVIALTAFSNNTGIIAYTDDQAGNATILKAIGFTWSGTTITLGTPVNLATSQSLVAGATGVDYNMIPVSSNQAILSYTSSGPSDRLAMLTYNNINSISIGTAVTPSSSGVTQLVPSSTHNPSYFIQTNLGGSASRHRQYYRG